MKSPRRAVLYGFFLWLIPFIVGFAIYPVRENNYSFFETIMPIALTICAVVFGVLYMKNVEEGFIAEGIEVGIIWFFIALVIDLFMFMWGPMKMSFWNYIKDIGFTYLIYPTVTIGFGILLNHRNKTLNEREDVK